MASNLRYAIVLADAPAKSVSDNFSLTESFSDRDVATSDTFTTDVSMVMNDGSSNAAAAEVFTFSDSLQICKSVSEPFAFSEVIGVASVHQVTDTFLSSENSRVVMALYAASDTFSLAESASWHFEVAQPFAFTDALAFGFGVTETFTTTTATVVTAAITVTDTFTTVVSLAQTYAAAVADAATLTESLVGGAAHAVTDTFTQALATAPALAVADVFTETATPTIPQAALVVSDTMTTVAALLHTAAITSSDALTLAESSLSGGAAHVVVDSFSQALGSGSGPSATEAWLMTLVGLRDGVLTAADTFSMIVALLETAAPAATDTFTMALQATTGGGQVLADAFYFADVGVATDVTVVVTAKASTDSTFIFSESMVRDATIAGLEFFLLQESNALTASVLANSESWQLRETLDGGFIQLSAFPDCDC